MAQRKEFRNSKTFSSPSPVVHPEVSAQWTRDGRGDILISLKVPRDVIRCGVVCEDDQRTLWYTDGPLELIQLEEVLEPVAHPQQDYKREDLAP